MRYEDGMSVSYPIRPVDDAEWEGFARVSESAFNSRWPREEMMRLDRMVVEPGRTLVAFDGDQMVGIFTDRDAVVKVAGRTIGSAAVRDVMTPDPVVLRPDDTLAVAIHKMAVGGFRHIPVVDAAGRPTAVVSAADVFRHLATALG